MMNDLNPISVNERTCPMPRTAWGYLGTIVVLAGVIALLLTSNGARDVANSKPAKGEAASLGATGASPSVVTRPLRIQNQSEQTYSIQPHDWQVQPLGNFAMATGESGFGPFSGSMRTGRCSSDDICHYNVASTGAEYSDEPAVEQATSGETASFDPRCAAEDLKAYTRIEQLGIADEVPSEKLASAAQMMLTARLNCAHGRVNEALGQYENLLGSELASNRAK
jgi:hypothetical protein